MLEMDVELMQQSGGCILDHFQELLPKLLRILWIFELLNVCKTPWHKCSVVRSVSEHTLALYMRDCRVSVLVSRIYNQLTLLMLE